MARALRTFTAFLSVLVAASCWRATAQGISPSSAEYPSLNTNSVRRIELTVTIPAALSFEVVRGWRATASDDQCRRVSNVLSGPVFPLTLALPITLSGEGTTRHASVATDEFLSGRCNWKFRGITFGPMTPAGIGGPLFFYDETAESAEDVTLEEWCIKTDDKKY